MKKYDTVEIDNREIINQIADECDEVMGHNPFSKADFKRAIDEILVDTLGHNYIFTPIQEASNNKNGISRNEIVTEVVNWLAEYLGDY